MTAPSWPDLFSALFTDVDGFLELRAFSSAPLLEDVERAFVKSNDTRAIKTFLHRQARRDCYFGVALRKSPKDGTLANCGSLTALFSDVDFKHSSEVDARAMLTRFPYKPTAVVFSGGGLHCYWALVEPIDLTTESHRAYSLLRRLALAVSGDLSAAEPARVLRVPNTLNFKPDYPSPRPVRIESLDPERRYHASEFDDWLPPEPESTRTGEPFTLPEEIAEGDPGRNNMLFSFARKLKASGMREGEIRNALLAANTERCKPPLPSEEVERLATHAATMPDRPEFQRDTGTGQSLPDTASLLAPLTSLPESASPEAVESALLTVTAGLVGASSLRRATVRELMLKATSRFQLSSPTRMVDAALSTLKDAGKSTEQGDAIVLSDPEPWPEPVDGAQLLDAIAAAVTRFVTLPTKEAGDAVALWTVNAHAHDAGDVSPFLCVNSAVKRSGKTRLLSVLYGVLPRVLLSSNLSTACFYRTVEDHKPTLLVDEGDTFLELSDATRGILNAGHTKLTSKVMRMEGDNHESRVFSTWCPKAIALIGKLPDTLADRSIIVTMKRKTRGDRTERFRVRKLKELEPLCRQAWRWAKDNFEPLAIANPEVPGELDDRAADNWGPLLAIADQAGGDWPDRARKAAKVLSSIDTRGDSEIGVWLLADIRTIFEKATLTRKENVDRLASAEMLKELVALEERPWADWPPGRHGKPLTTRHLAQLLEPFGIKPDTIRIGETTLRGYKLSDGLGDAFARYLPSEVQHPQQTNNDGDLDHDSIRNKTPHVAHTKPDLSMREQRNVADVADRNPENGGGADKVGSAYSVEDLSL